MTENPQHFIAVEQLRVGMYIELGVSWMAHPFPSGSFKISSQRQIEAVKALKLARVRYVAAKSDVPVPSLAPEPVAPVAVALDPPPPAVHQPVDFSAQRIAYQQESLAACERQFNAALGVYRQTVAQLSADPATALGPCEALLSGFVKDLLHDGESAIRLLSEGVGERAVLHPVNVAVLSLLLGKAAKLGELELLELGLAAFLHDIGKSQLPDQLRWLQENFSPDEYQLYQSHVAHGVSLGQRMGLSKPVLMAIAQHHELMDGSGFPARLKAVGLTRPAKILALVNRYENLCNPSRASLALTPHEALQHLFAQHKSRFDTSIMSVFIRMMGVYPPGSVVQLVDGRYAIVVSVNSTRPLKPRVIVHEPKVPKEKAPILDLEYTPGVGIRRSLKPAALPPEAFIYLAPRTRMCYFFEHDAAPPEPKAVA
jgi:putative nucleotidyltransferase with HDIG domain